MKNFYYLQIDGEDFNDLILESIDKILGVKHNTSDGWQYALKETKCIDYITFFMDILEGKYNALNEIGITRDMISIWHLYEYDGKCNLKYFPELFKRLGKNGITLCVSCWGSDVSSEKVLN